MPHFMCRTCGTEHDASPQPPLICRICSDERQYVGWQGQGWTTHAELAATHRNRLEMDQQLFGVGVAPNFAIPQRALHLPEAGVLWETTALVTDEAVAELKRRGGVQRIAISHPHFYAAMVRWSEALGGVPVFVHENDRLWVSRTWGAVRRCCAARAISLAARCCTGRAPSARCCWRAIRCMWPRTGATSASCTACPTTCRRDRRWCGRRRRGCAGWRSTMSTASRGD